VAPDQVRGPEEAIIRVGLLLDWAVEVVERDTGVVTEVMGNMEEEEEELRGTEVPGTAVLVDREL
jgi:hypothetical protein